MTDGTGRLVALLMAPEFDMEEPRRERRYIIRGFGKALAEFALGRGCSVLVGIATFNLLTGYFIPWWDNIAGYGVGACATFVVQYSLRQFQDLEYEHVSG